MKLIVGLGNPGVEYEKTRHNAGFMAMDEIAKILHITYDQKKFKGVYTKARIKGEKVYLLKPQTYMNLSGECVQKMMDYFDIDPQDILVMYDDLDLATGQLRLRKKGSSGGQKGMKNIMQHIGSQELKRIRIGIDKDARIPTIDYVLGKVSKEDKAAFETGITNAAKAAIAFVHEDFEKVMQDYNGK
ncbi:MAG: aminoacyl-tRNA hydrolase [Breznakia sp.]